MATAPKSDKPKAKPAKAKPPKAADDGTASLNRMRVTNWARWGDLIKCWSTGRPHRANKKSYPVPRSLDELRAQCKDLNIGLNVPDYVKNLVVYTHERTTLVIRVPPADFVMESEKHLLKKGSKYNLPSFYADAFGMQGEVPDFPNAESVLDFHASRIGDYSISNCQ
jgi:hypothetical protein